ncbi:hypothetical protein F8M41_001677 [Gigaspora margarita]|uniref:Uncharacterized protein n=1 Tax=Gigaspora margarita TaxID=4874 RepID=A0A8H4A925_GIGMA|nr:hypothetical protein F8M41_001677 [Gigaspora margarita]
MIHLKSTSITALFRQEILMVTTIAITGHKSKFLYRVYARPSGKDKEDALSSLINNIELPLKQTDNHKNLSTTHDDTQDDQTKPLESKIFMFV